MTWESISLQLNLRLAVTGPLNSVSSRSGI